MVCETPISKMTKPKNGLEVVAQAEKHLLSKPKS
jgi:hypothetical protein